MEELLARFDFAFAEPTGFWCRSPRSTDPSDRYFATVIHRLRVPATEMELWLLRQLLGEVSAEVEAFYRHHDGCVLYSDTNSDATGIHLYPIRQWEPRTAKFRTGHHGTYYSEQDPDQLLTGIVIGEVPQSGNYFVVPTAGPKRGHVFYANHDTADADVPFAPEFTTFLASLMDDPAKLLSERLGCYTRYSDGRTKIDWIPEEYVG